jgi:cytochrome P450
MQDTLAINAFRALALIASHPVQRSQLDEELAEIGRDGPDAGEVARLDYLEACLEEAMRLWPTTTMLSREAVEDTVWNGERVPAGTQLVISNVFNHRDRERHDYADRFAPEEWTEGDAAEDWSFNHFSHGPQGCPGAGLALFIGKAVLASLLVRRTFRLEQPKLDPGKSLPHMLDYFSIRVGIGPRA